MKNTEPPSSSSSDSAPARRPLPGVVWATAWVSFLTDLATELVYPLLPVLYKTTLGLGAAWLGLIEGTAETVAALTKLFSGHWSDRTGGRKWWMVAGYSLSAVTKPLLVLAGGGVQVLGLRASDRVGKGIRGAPRDALISRVIAVEERGRAFGVQRALDHAGAMTGALLASALLALSWVTLHALFWWSLLPGLLAVMVILVFVHEARDKNKPKADESHRPSEPASLIPSLRSQSTAMKRYLFVLAVFCLGNSTDALLLMRANDQFTTGGMSDAAAVACLPLLWAWLHLIKTATSAWGGRLSDRRGRALPLRAGWLVYGGVYVGFAFWDGIAAPWVLFAVYGVYYGLVEGPERALVADLSAGRHERGTAYGLFHFVVGLSALPASLLCGALWKWYGHQTAFLTGGGLALLAVVLLPWALHGVRGANDQAGV